MLMGFGWTEALLVGAVVASTDAAAVLFLLRARGLRLRSRVAATLEIVSGTNDPFAIFLTILLVELLLTGDQPWGSVAASLAGQGLGGAAIGLIGGRLIVLALNRLALPQGLHAPFVASAALGVFGLGQALHASGFLAVYLAGLMVGNRPTRAHGTVVVFLDAVTWLAQIVMFVLLGLLAWPEQLMDYAAPALVVAAVLMLFARPLAVFLCLIPFRFSWRDKVFISWVGLRGAVGIFSLDTAVGRARPCPALFQHRLRRRAHLAAGPGLDAGAGGAVSAHRSAARRSCPAAGRAQTSPASSNRNSSAITCRPTTPICAARSFRPGRSSCWWCATRRCSPPPKPVQFGRAIMCIFSPRRRRRKHLIASLSKCRRRPRRIRACSAISS